MKTLYNACVFYQKPVVHCAVVKGWCPLKEWFSQLLSAFAPKWETHKQCLSLQDFLYMILLLRGSVLIQSASFLVYWTVVKVVPVPYLLIKKITDLVPGWPASLARSFQAWPSSSPATPPASPPSWSGWTPSQPSHPCLYTGLLKKRRLCSATDCLVVWDWAWCTCLQLLPWVNTSTPGSPWPQVLPSSTSCDSILQLQALPGHRYCLQVLPVTQYFNSRLSLATGTAFKYRTSCDSVLQLQALSGNRYSLCACCESVLQLQALPSHIGSLTTYGESILQR